MTTNSVRNGVCNLFMMFEPLAPWRHIEVTDQRTAIDYAVQMKSLVDEYYPDAIASYGGT